jgi:hypothetical protein
MVKSLLPILQNSEAMSDPRYVVQAAAAFASGLTLMRSRGPGDIPNAMRSIEREYGIGYSFLWGLRYRRDRVKDVGASIFFKLRAAYEAECSKQIRKLEHEVSIARQIAGASDPDVCTAQTVVQNARPTRRIR